MPFKMMYGLTLVMLILVAGMAAFGFIDAGALNDEDFWKNFSSDLELFDTQDQIDSTATTDIESPDFFDPTLGVAGQVLGLLGSLLTIFISTFLVLVTLPFQVISIINIFG